MFVYKRMSAAAAKQDENKKREESERRSITDRAPVAKLKRN